MNWKSEEILNNSKNPSMKNLYRVIFLCFYLTSDIFINLLILLYITIYIKEVEVEGIRSCLTCRHLLKRDYNIKYNNLSTYKKKYCKT